MLVIANLINLIDIEVVIVGGGVTNAGELFLAPLQAVVTQETANIPSRTVSILPSRLGDNAGVMGAIALAQQKQSTFFS
ncbi:MAG: ROK family protein [Okeania sp. SIO2G4]|uniref:ROK family protein n=1 Tax=unclassified Okeania TaxID=2634635 RepID=UPI0013B98739|nr:MULTISPECIES: ROK family protein [unclassified Okeania]NEP05230.1 ROK family protein [Okeania sp. SIO4D6]NEP43032.1 ROK family protein [Okeania sp. SIO2H7]NEP71048.1 ROK family protein [Okeania sp. SIO2G5]NEP91532.1 ROK family protein [Okeania sp. SIO2F5]NEQ89408.1 ROK family protein [Okeania sp. SIO2G4]